MHTTNSIKKYRLPVTTIVVLFSMIGLQASFAKGKASTTEQGTVNVNESVLQELLEERCKIEADHRLAQDNPENQTQDEFAYLCIHRWQVRLQVKK